MAQSPVNVEITSPNQLRITVTPKPLTLGHILLGLTLAGLGGGMGSLVGADHTRSALKDPVCRPAFNEAQKSGRIKPDVQLQTVIALNHVDGSPSDPVFSCTIATENHGEIKVPVAIPVTAPTP